MKKKSGRRKWIVVILASISGVVLTSLGVILFIMATSVDSKATNINGASQQSGSMPHPENKIRNENMLLPPSHQFYDDILVILHFNSPRYNHLPLLLEYYGKVFKNLLVCGQQAHSLVDYVCKKDQINNGGHMMYGCIADVMETYPNYTGYLSFHFDLIMNYWNFVNLDKNNSWITFSADNSGPHPLSQYPTDNTKPSGWYWWSTKWGLPACRKAMKALPQQYKDKLRNKYGSEDVIWRGMGDLFYVPQRMRTEFVSLTRLFVKNEVFLEIAIPTIPIMIEAPNTPLHLTGSFDWWSRRFDEYWKPDHHFAHPFRFHEYGMYNKFRQIMMRGFVE